MRRLLSSGWWVLPVAVVVTAAAVWSVLSSANRGPMGVGNGRTPETYGFDLGGLASEHDTLLAGGVPRDHVPVLVDPEAIQGSSVAAVNQAERGKLLVPDDRVIGLVVAGQARAYPLRLLKRHEVVNDTLGGQPVVVVYAALGDVVVAADRSLDGEVVELAGSGLLVDSLPLLFDRRDQPAASSLWHVVDLAAVSGPAAGSRLRLLPLQVTTWAGWYDGHPDTTVLAPVPEMTKLYRRDAYHSYMGSDLLRFPVAPLPPDDGLRLKDRLVIIGDGDAATPLALSRLAGAAGSDTGTWRGRAAGTDVRIHFRLDPGTAVIERAEGSELDLPVRWAFRFAWHARHPNVPIGP